MSSRRKTPLLPGSRDGTSQRSRTLPALDPAHAPIDERTSADLLRFVQDYAKEQLRFFDIDPTSGTVQPSGTWGAFAESKDLTNEQILAYLADPARFGDEARRWLGRPHFALLLTFVELLRHPREHLNDFTRRHLDHYYRELLALQAKPAVPDRATVILGLGPAAREALVPAGTPLRAGRDPGNIARIYRTEREILVNRAAVTSLRSVFVDRRITGIPDVRRESSLTAAEALTGTLRIALGSPKPGDEVPKFKKRVVDAPFLKGLTRPPEVRDADLLDFAWKKLYLKHFELAELMRLYRRRTAGVEWAEINRLIGVTAPSKPRAFLENLESRVGDLDFDLADHLPMVDTIDDLYLYREDQTDYDGAGGPDVAAFITEMLGNATPPIEQADWEAAMQLKLLVDGEWNEINRILQRIGRRRLGQLEWPLPAPAPGAVEPDFDANLRAAVGTWPPPWPWGTTGIDAYETLVRELEAHLFMPVERIEVLSAFAHEIGTDDEANDYDWSEVDRILADAHRDMVYARRRTDVNAARAGGSDAAALLEVVNFVLGNKTEPMDWEDAREAIADRMASDRHERLVAFHDALVAGTTVENYGWTDVVRDLELAWRSVQAFPDPVARKVEVRNIYAYDDATLVKDATSPGWRTFGRRPPVDAVAQQGATLGWSLRSPALSLSEGTRTITLTLGLKKDSFDAAEFTKALRWDTDTIPPTLVAALGRALTVEVSTLKGWIELPLAAARIATGTGEDHYWAVAGIPRALPENRPALQLNVVLGPSLDPLAPLKGESQAWPGLRITLRPRLVRRDGKPEEWLAPIEIFEPLVLSAVHLKVKVEGLSSLRLQQDDRVLDPKKPMEPFGSRPAMGARLYVDHPELMRARLEELTFKLEWMGLPASLKDHYINYTINSATDFKTEAMLVDRSIPVVVASEVPLFDIKKDSANNEIETKPDRTISIPDVNTAIKVKSPLFNYTSRNDLKPADDVRHSSRYLRFELMPIDFGHGAYPALAAEKARLLAIAASGGKPVPDTDAYKYRVNPPYTPTLKSLSVTYSTSIELDPTVAQTEHLILHAHPFGVSPIDAELPSLMPRYQQAGELYLGVRDLRPPQHLALLLQLAEGTSDPDIEPATPVWSYLAGERFVSLTGGGVLNDTTRGLINSGIVELALPPAASSGRLPPELYWLRVAIPRSPRAVCDVVGIHAQAVSVLFDDEGNDPRHYQQPLPAGTIKRMVTPDARIASIKQPYTSYGGRPAEEPGVFNTRVSERLRHKQRALSAWDYERLVLQRFRQIYKAKVLSVPGGGVDVIVIPDIRELTPADTFAPKAPANLLADIQTYLTERAPSAAHVQVRNARYIPVRVRLGVRFRKGVDEGFAQRRLNEDLVRFLSPWAFDEGAELMIGGRIYANSIIDFVDRREYVDYVAGIKLFRCLDGENFKLVMPVTENGVELHYVPTDRPDQVLVAAQQHDFDIIPEAGFEPDSFTGINYMRIELDFIVG